MIVKISLPRLWECETLTEIKVKVYIPNIKSETILINLYSMIKTFLNHNIQVKIILL